MICIAKCKGKKVIKKTKGVAKQAGIEVRMFEKEFFIVN